MAIGVALGPSWPLGGGKGRGGGLGFGGLGRVECKNSGLKFRVSGLAFRSRSTASGRARLSWSLSWQFRLHFCKHLLLVVTDATSEMTLQEGPFNFARFPQRYVDMVIQRSRLKPPLRP